MPQRGSDLYQSLRTKIRKWIRTDGKSSKWAEYILIAPDLLHLLCRLSVDKEVPLQHRAKLAVVIAYFVSPFDLIPEGIFGPIGYVDDVALAAYVLHAIVNNTNPEVVKKHWSGEGDILELIKEILKVANEMVGSGLWEKLKRVVK